MSIVELAEEESEKRGGVAIHAVHLRLGPCAGVVREALLACFGMACEGTALASSRLVIEETPIVVYCDACQAEITLPSMLDFTCVQCRAPVSRVLKGRELEVVALEIE